MTKPMQGPILFAQFEKLDTFTWIDPTTNIGKPITTFKVLLPHGDGTVSRESITLPPNYKPPVLTAGTYYGFPVVVKYNKKRQQITWEARSDLLPISHFDIKQ